MDLKQLDLFNLNTLWEASSDNIDLKTKLENEFQVRIENNQQYSREDLFEISIIEKHAMGIWFIPTSNAYNSYGPHVTVSLILNKEELSSIGKNLILKPRVRTFGVVKVEVLVSRRFTSSQVEKLKQEGFNTNEILRIQTG